jgi:DNA-binding YbaB/EbfC family protein
MKSGNMGGMNMQQMMKQAQKMKEQMEEAKEELADTEVTATSGGGMVTVVMNGNKEMQSIKIKPEAVDPDDVETLEDLITAAINKAYDAAQKLYDEIMGPFSM